MKLAGHLGAEGNEDPVLIPEESKTTTAVIEEELKFPENDDCHPFLPDNIKLEAADSKEIDIEYHNISMTDLMHVDTQLLSRKEPLMGEAGIVRIKTESILDLKIEPDEGTVLRFDNYIPAELPT